MPTMNVICSFLYLILYVYLVSSTGETPRKERAILGGGEKIQGIVGGGSPGKDFPALSSVPRTNFDCKGRHPGYYADEEFGCQVFHICHLDRRKDSFLCPNGTIFHQQKLVCDWWYNVDCELSDLHENVNAEIGNPNSARSTSERSQSSLAANDKSRLQSSQFENRGTTQSSQIGGFSDVLHQSRDLESGSRPPASHFGGSVERSQLTHNGGSGALSKLSSFGVAGDSGGSQPSHVRGSGGRSQSFRITGNTIDSSSQSSPSRQHSSDRSQTSQFAFSSGSRSTHNQHHPSFQSINNQQNTKKSHKGETDVKKDTSNFGISQVVGRNHVQEVRVKKRPVTPTGIPFPQSLPRNQLESSLKQRTGKVIPSVSIINTEPPITTISPRSDNFHLTNSFTPVTLPKTDKAKHKFGSNIPSKQSHGIISNVKKVKVNKRPITTVVTNNHVSNRGTHTTFRPLVRNQIQGTTGVSKKEFRVFNEKNVANQFFNLGQPVAVSNNLGRPLSSIGHTTIRSKTNNVGRPLPRTEVQPVTAGLPLSVTRSRTNVGNQITSVSRVQTQNNLSGDRHTVSRNDVRRLQNSNTGRPLPVTNQVALPTPSRSLTSNRGSVTFKTSLLGNSLKRKQSTRSQQTPPRINQQQTPPRINQQQTPPRINQQQTPPRINQQQTPPRINQQQTPPRINQPATVTVHRVLDDDRIDDLDDLFDDDKFDLDDRFDDDRFDDDRFDDDRFDDDRFDDDRFDDDRFDDDRFDDDRFDDDRFDDDRFDNDPFDDDRFDFDDDDRFDNDFDDRIKRFGNSAGFSFERNARGSTFSSAFSSNDSSDEKFIKLGIKPPPEIQLPPPPRK